MNKPNWIIIAEGELGVKEIPGKENNPRIVEYHSTCTLKAGDDETSWCSAFVNWVFYKLGMGRTKSAAARSWLDWGITIDQPEYGCVAIFTRGNSPIYGHVGFYVGDDPNNKDKILVLGGNQGDEVCIKSFPKSMLLGYRKPKDA